MKLTRTKDWEKNGYRLQCDLFSDTNIFFILMAIEMI